MLEVAVTILKSTISNVTRGTTNCITIGAAMAKGSTRHFITFFMFLLKLFAKIFITGLLVHVLFVWPSGGHIFGMNVSEFKLWVNNIKDIPTPMWGILSAVIVGLATSEVVSNYKKNNRSGDNND